MTLFPVDDMFAQVKLGRSLWIGMFPDPSASLLENRQRIIDAPGPDFYKETEPPEKLHVTLAHLGKNMSLRKVEDIHAALELAASLQSGILAVAMTAALRLKLHVAIALVPDAVIGMRNKLRASLDDRKVGVSDRFAMTPHITIARLAFVTDSPPIPFTNDSLLHFRSLTMVCGESRITVPFHE